ncbi:MAG TPA: SRPBCC domain-containing protein [Acidimicrobiales bacterium]|nr:SRPBCC domain-containing protein [Acidimicrobiales bacterium]
MTVKDVTKDPKALTMRITAELDAPIERCWQLWADPRQLERWWGPPTYPATFVDHDLSAGGKVSYFMTGPDGEKFHGYWTVVSVDPPRVLEVTDGFADENGTHNDDLPITSMTVTLSEGGSGRTVMVIESHFPSLEAMQQMIEMGMEEGMTLAMGQIDAILAER